MNAILKLVTQYWHHEETEAVKPLRVGDYIADYSALTAEEIAQTDPECEELFKHSQPLPR